MYAIVLLPLSWSPEEDQVYQPPKQNTRDGKFHNRGQSTACFLDLSGETINISIGADHLMFSLVSRLAVSAAARWSLGTVRPGNGYGEQ
jgi:hypothetical protein